VKFKKGKAFLVVFFWFFLVFFGFFWFFFGFFGFFWFFLFFLVFFCFFFLFFFFFFFFDATTYEIHMENIIMRLRFAKCVAHAKTQFGDEVCVPTTNTSHSQPFLQTSQHHITPHHTTSHHITPHHTTSHRITPYHTVSRRITALHVHCAIHAHTLQTQAEIVIEELIEHGRCSIERVITRATDWVIQFRGASAPITGKKGRRGEEGKRGGEGKREKGRAEKIHIKVYRMICKLLNYL
jgi:hypothetical protein